MAEANNSENQEKQLVTIDHLTGPQRTAILMMLFGQDAAAEVFRKLDPREVQLIGQAMSSMPSVSKDDIEAVVEHFIQDLEKETGLAFGADNYMRSVLSSALGEDRADGIIERIMSGTVSGGGHKNLDALKWMDARSIAEIIRHEHPQIIAIVLSHLEGVQAAEVLGLLPQNIHADLLMRIATLERIPPEALEELNEIMEKQVSGKSTLQASKVGGVKVAAEIMNNLDSGIEEPAMNSIKETDAELGQEIEDLMFVFADLAGVDDRSIQTLMREIATETLVLALKAADNDLKEKFLKNMSKRAAEMLRDDLEAMGPVKLADVEGAQKDILASARRLADDGQINLGGGDDYV